MGDVAVVGAVGESAPARPRPGGWILVGVVWLLALTVAATLFWVLPRAATASDLAQRRIALQVALTAANAAEAKARADLATLQAELSSLQSEHDALVAIEGRQSAAVKSLDAKIKALRAAKAAAAARATHAGTYSIPPPPPPPSPHYSCHVHNGIVTCK